MPQMTNNGGKGLKYHDSRRITVNCCGWHRPGLALKQISILRFQLHPCILHRLEINHLACEGYRKPILLYAKGRQSQNPHSFAIAKQFGTLHKTAMDSQILKHGHRMTSGFSEYVSASVRRFRGKRLNSSPADVFADSKDFSPLHCISSCKLRFFKCNRNDRA